MKELKLQVGPVGAIVAVTNNLNVGLFFDLRLLSLGAQVGPIVASVWYK